MPAPGLELVILIGLQGAGKSTFRRKFVDATHVVVSNGWCYWTLPLGGHYDKFILARAEPAV